MTIIEAINKTDALKPNNYSQEEKAEWLSVLDGIIKKNIIDTHDGGSSTAFSGYDIETNTDAVLLVKPPYDEIYIRWLEAQIDYANGEYGKYNNSMLMYNNAYSAFERYYNRNYMPIGTKFKYF